MSKMGPPGFEPEISGFHAAHENDLRAVAL